MWLWALLFPFGETKGYTDTFFLLHLTLFGTALSCGGVLHLADTAGVFHPVPSRSQQLHCTLRFALVRWKQLKSFMRSWWTLQHRPACRLEGNYNLNCVVPFNMPRQMISLPSLLARHQCACPGPLWPSLGGHTAGGRCPMPTTHGGKPPAAFVLLAL